MRKRHRSSHGGVVVWARDETRTDGRLLGELFDTLGPVVYAVRSKDDLIKIGYTNNLARRARQVGFGFASILAWQSGGAQEEAAIHRRLRGNAARGREWYPWSEPVLEVVNEMRAALGVAPLDK